MEEMRKIVANEGVAKTTEEIMNVDFGKDFKTAAVVGLTVFVGIVAYKFIVKPIMAQKKAKKNQQEWKPGLVAETTDVDNEEETSEDES